MLELETYGFDEAERGLVRLVAMLSDLRPFWPRLVPLFIEWMRLQFETEGEWGGQRWPELSVDYATRKTRLYPGKGLLVATGDLRQAASRPRRVALPQSLTLIIDDSGYAHGRAEPRAVAAFHQFGGGSTEIGGVAGRPPRRPLIPEMLPPAASAQLDVVAEEWVAEMVDRLGLR